LRPEELEESPHTLQTTYMHLEELVTEWWVSWVTNCFPEMVGRTKWTVPRRDLKVGDVGHIKYEVKFGRLVWKLAKVAEVHPREDGRVRTVSVAYRQSHIKEKTLPYRAKDMTIMKIRVQRFALLYAVEEQEEDSRNSQEDPSELVSQL
jgi:hypothetical protein